MPATTFPNGGGLFAILPTSTAKEIFPASAATGTKTSFLCSCVALGTRIFGIGITDLVIRREHRWKPGQFRHRESWRRGHSNGKVEDVRTVLNLHLYKSSLWRILNAAYVPMHLA